MILEIVGNAGRCTDQNNNLIDSYLVEDAVCHDEFVEYMDEPLKSKLNSGYLSFRMKEGTLQSVVTYKLDEELTKIELQELIEYTSGQLSDGIGEGFEQHPCIEFEEEGECVEYYLSPWYENQQLTGKYIKK